MNIRDLQYLVAVAELQHFGRAAERCHVSQPTLSIAVRKLEEELGQTLFDRVRTGVLAYLDYHAQHPHESRAAHVGLGRSDPMLRWADEADNERQMRRILDAVHEVGAIPDPEMERYLQAIVYGWLAFTLELCRQRIIGQDLDAGRLADTCAHALLDAVARIPDLPEVLARAVAADGRQ